MATELSDQDTVGTALTLQMALGFSVTVLAIFAIPLVEVRIASLLALINYETITSLRGCCRVCRTHSAVIVSSDIPLLSMFLSFASTGVVPFR